VPKNNEDGKPIENIFSCGAARAAIPKQILMSNKLMMMGMDNNKPAAKM
jgi:hypothetical protein